MIDKILLQNLYEKGNSIAEIATKLKISCNKVYYWMDKHSLKRRSISQAVYQKCNPHGDPFKIKLQLNEEEKILLGLGIGLFWGEGMKTSKNSVRLGNTDPFIILYFKKFLKTICGVKEDKIKYSLQLFGDTDQNKAVQFWCDVLKIKSIDLGKVSIIKFRGKGTYKIKNQFGVLQIACHNKKFKGVIDNFIRTLKTSNAVVAQMVEQLHGETV